MKAVVAGIALCVLTALVGGWGDLWSLLLLAGCGVFIVFVSLVATAFDKRRLTRRADIDADTR